MLLANVSSAREVHRNFPQCAVLRRHPSPPPSNFEPLLKAVSRSLASCKPLSSRDLLGRSCWCDPQYSVVQGVGCVIGPSPAEWTALSQHAAAHLGMHACFSSPPCISTAGFQQATRCMLPAKYFSSGTVVQSEFSHYGARWRMSITQTIAYLSHE